MLKACSKQINFDHEKELKNLGAIFESYHSSFKQIAHLKREIGLTPKTGLYGPLRNSVHTAEENIKELSEWELIADILMLRRREKDFMLRLDPKYLGKFEQDIQIFTTALNNKAITNDKKSIISKHMQAYAEDFRALTSKVIEVSSNISNTSEHANDAYNETVTGKDKVKQVVSYIVSLEETTLNTKNVLNELNQDCNNVIKFMSVIRGIAEQTNLLALNVAIEAARAGEQGRGFAVVADEVRMLAGKTQESTEEIDLIVQRLQSNAENAVAVMEASHSQVQETVSQAHTAEQSLNTVTEKVNEINSMSTQIAAAAEEQSVVAEDMSQKIVEIKDHAEINTENSKKTLAASEEQARLSNELEQLVSQFKV